MLGLLLSAALPLLATAARPIDAAAKVSAVTVFNDRARVVRTGTVALAASGSSLVEVALLPGSVDVASVRLEAAGAEVRRVDLARIDETDYPLSLLPAQALLDKLEHQDDLLLAVARERQEQARQLTLLLRIKPELQPDLPPRPVPKLNAGGWAQSLAFFESSLDKAQGKLRALDQKQGELQRERENLAAEAQRLGVGTRRAGLKVSALLSGHGEAQLTLTYLVGGARWTPAWDLTYLPAQEKVQVALSGLVSQQTGEAWDEAQLTLSTAVPGVSSQLPKLLTWKLGQKERFEPQSRAQRPPAPPQPAPYAPPVRKGVGVEASPRAEADVLRGKLLQRAGQQLQLEALSSSDEQAEGDAGDEEEGGTGALGGSVSGVLGGVAAGRGAAAPSAAPPPPTQRAQLRMMEKRAASDDLGLDLAPSPARAAPRPKSSAAAASANEVKAERASGSYKSAPAPVPTEEMGLGPPPSYRPPSFGPDAPASLAGGFDLSFTSPRPATVPSGGVARRVPLLAETWPVASERVIYPALAKEAWLLATLKNPSQRALPGGPADLFVGDDPAGTARLQLVAPGEPIELPLGLDRAIKPVRNVTQVQGEKGLFSKDEVTQYTVTIEVGNPYQQAIPLRVVDQVPLNGDKNAEVKLLKTSPETKPNADTGQLEWRLEVPASGRAQVSFTYELKRPKGALVHQ